jgi:hypothetical protein
MKHKFFILFFFSKFKWQINICISHWMRSSNFSTGLSHDLSESKTDLWEICPGEQI